MSGLGVMGARGGDDDRDVSGLGVTGRGGKTMTGT